MKTADRPQTIQRVVQEAVETLSAAKDLVPHLEAESLLAFTLGKSRAYLFAWPEKTLTPDELKRFRNLILRRLKGEPHAYLTGQKAFWSLLLKVSRETLIPRPETELLVERALELLPLNLSNTIADLGTGSGAIAAALAHERPMSQIWATDRSAAALAVARENFQRIGLRNIACAEGNWCEALPSGINFSLIVSNPPYIRAGDPHLGQGGLPWEPVGALVSGETGLNDLRQIIDQAFAHLLPGGWLLLEHGFDQGSQVRLLLAERGYVAIRTRHDLSGLDRLTEGHRPTQETGTNPGLRIGESTPS